MKKEKGLLISAIVQLVLIVFGFVALFMERHESFQDMMIFQFFVHSVTEGVFSKGIKEEKYDQ